MLRVMLEKLWHKKYMVVCLLLGSILLIATAVSFPMYKNAAYNRMLQDEFENSLRENGTWPATNSMVMISKKDSGGKSIARMEEFHNGLCEQLGVSEKQKIAYYSLAKANINSEMNRDDAEELSVRLSFLSELPEHVNLQSGEMYSEDGLTDDGRIEVVVSESAMVAMNLLVGEELEFDSLKDASGETIRVKVTGVFTENENTDFYWQFSTNELDNVMLMEENLFRENFTGENAEKYTVTCSYYSLFDFTSLKADHVEQLKTVTNYILKDSPFRNTMSIPDYKEMIDSYEQKQTRIDATLVILQIPVLILLGAFLMMISGQMYDMERNEISVLKSRGASGNQIFRLYLYQSICLAAIGFLLGLPLGRMFCKLLGSADNFLQFNFKRELVISYTKEVFFYGLVAMVVAVCITTLPAVKHSRVTIVKLKQQKSAKKRSWWEKCFLDVILLGVSVYGYYSYSRNASMMTERVLKGEALDPLLYLSSSLFILGLGLLLIRLQPFFVKIIYMAGQKWWKPASYASFMETIKNGRKQQFIMLFMILTISLGMFHATVARTILQNARENKAYIDGADLMIQEVWGDNSVFTAMDNTIEFQYYEPDYSKYAKLTGAASYTRVLLDDQATVAGEGKEKYAVSVMGIHTREFGENTDIEDALLAEPYYQYLNELAQEPNGVLVSKSFKVNKDLKEGDTITFKNGDGTTAKGKIIAFVDYWPGYEPTTTSLSEDGTVRTTDNYLVIANLASLQQYWGVTPYQVWITVKEGETTDFFYEWIHENQISVKDYRDRAKDLDDVTEDPLLQGTNGILTMSFIVMILLCAVGYLIYWIMSIRSREMMFGVLRACGLHKNEVFQMLTLEQIFSGIYSIFAGIGIGKAASEMFVPMLQSAYAAQDQVLPMKLITDASDLIRLYSVIAVVMLLCLTVLTVLVFRLNIAKALKLGEE